MGTHTGYRIQRQRRGGQPVPFFFQGKPEIYEPNILDPGETMQILINLWPAATENMTNLATVVTPNGARSQIAFGW
jgi:hypothetical protein